LVHRHNLGVRRSEAQTGGCILSQGREVPDLGEPGHPIIF
jgi:hypothetical protein